MIYEYQVEEFYYLPRQDGSNGRIKDYEISFSADLVTWTTPVKGQFQDNSNKQTVVITAKPMARFFKLVAKSEVQGRAWASAAELGIEASKRIIPSAENCDEIKAGEKYYLKHFYSGLYLQYKPNTTEGDFCLNPRKENDENFIYTFNPVPGTADTYNIGIKNLYINGEGGWLFRLGNRTDTYGRIQVNKQNDCTFFLRGLWKTGQYFNFDATTPDSYVYSDKATGAYWIVEKVSGNNEIHLVDASDVSVYPTITNGYITISVPCGNANVKVIDLYGRIIDSYIIENETTLPMNYSDGVYFVCVETNNNSSIHKVLLNK